MHYKYLKNAKYYMSLLEQGRSHVLFNHLAKQSKENIESELVLLKNWILETESSRLEEIYHTIEINLLGKMRQVVNYIEGFLVLPAHHLAQTGITTDSHRYSNEYYEESY